MLLYINSMKEIIFDHVSLFYENSNKQIITGLNDLSLSFPFNKINVIVGYSGCGKTSLLKCLTDQLVYESNIYFDDVNLNKIPLKDRKISYVSQDIILYPKLNVYENIIFPLKNGKINYEEADQKVKRIAKELEIDLLLTRNIKYLSIGQKSRVQLAKALVKDSDIYILDEFDKNLDPVVSKKIITKFIKNLKEENKTLIMATHNIEQATSLADYIYVINEGKLEGVFTPKEFISSDNKIVNSLLENEKK